MKKQFFLFIILLFLVIMLSSAAIVSACTSDADCGADQTCNTNKEICVDNKVSCTSDADCTGTDVCAKGTCVKCKPALESSVCTVDACGVKDAGCGVTYDCGPCCVPLTKSEACSGRECGTVSDGCTGTYSCGSCSEPQETCSGGTCCDSTCYSGWVCGTAGCGNSCGTCSTGSCQSRSCVFCVGSYCFDTPPTPPPDAPADWPDGDWSQPPADVPDSGTDEPPTTTDPVAPTCIPDSSVECGWNGCEDLGDSACDIYNVLDSGTTYACVGGSCSSTSACTCVGKFCGDDDGCGNLCNVGCGTGMYCDLTDAMGCASLTPVETKDNCYSDSFCASAWPNAADPSEYKCVNGVCDRPACLAPGSMIMTPDGEKPIETLKVGDQVISYIGDGKFKTYNISYVFVHDGIKDSYNDFERYPLTELEFADGKKITLTANHPLVTPNALDFCSQVENIEEGFIGLTVDFGVRETRVVKKTIFPDWEEVTYNLGIDGYPYNFIADGVVVHNACPGQTCSGSDTCIECASGSYCASGSDCAVKCEACNCQGYCDSRLLSPGTSCTTDCCTNGCGNDATCTRACDPNQGNACGDDGKTVPCGCNDAGVQTMTCTTNCIGNCECTWSTCSIPDSPCCLPEPAVTPDESRVCSTSCGTGTETRTVTWACDHWEYGNWGGCTAPTTSSLEGSTCATTSEACGTCSAGTLPFTRTYDECGVCDPTWIEGTCTIPGCTNLPACPTAGIETASCGVDLCGTKSRTVTTGCCGGCVESAWDESNCKDCSSGIPPCDYSPACTKSADVQVCGECNRGTQTCTYETACTGYCSEPPSCNSCTLNPSYTRWFDYAYYSGDGDNCGDATVKIEVCSCTGPMTNPVDKDGVMHPGKYVCNKDDYDDTDPAICATNAEICDQIDNDGDGYINEYLRHKGGYTETDPAYGSVTYAGGFNTNQVGVCENSRQSCLKNGAGVWSWQNDYLDIPDFENGPETQCDGLDNNCNGIIDEGCDSDLDGYIEITAKSCKDATFNPEGYIRVLATDVNSYARSDLVANPSRDVGPYVPACTNDDGSYTLSAAECVAACTTSQRDCLDTYFLSNPGMHELCDNRDNDCDNGYIGWSASTYDTDMTTGIDEGCDDDNDGYAQADMGCEKQFRNKDGDILPCKTTIDGQTVLMLDCDDSPGAYLIYNRAIDNINNRICVDGEWYPLSP